MRITRSASNIAPSPSSPYAYDQLYVLKAAIEAAGTWTTPMAVAKAIRALPVPSQVVMQYQPVDGKMFDENGQAYTSNGAFLVAEGKVGLRRGPAFGMRRLIRSSSARC